MQQVVAAELAADARIVDEHECHSRTVDLGHRDRVVQCHNGARGEEEELLVQCHDL